MIGWLSDRITHWLNQEESARARPPSDFDQLSFEVRPCDVILVEGNSRVSEVIKYVTLSSWTHSALYIGRLHDIDDPELRAKIERQQTIGPDEQLLVEAQLGEGTIVRPLSFYRNEHLRICRPNRLARQDAQRVIRFVVDRLGHRYDVRQIFDLLRFFIPYGLMPRRWRSTLFETHAGRSTKTVCSTLIGRAFASVHYPILPSLTQAEDGSLQLVRHNSKLLTPKDFDYSPYFDLIKYPVFDFDEMTIYRKLPWSADNIIFNSGSDYVAEQLKVADELTQPADDSPADDAGDPDVADEDTPEIDPNDLRHDNKPIAEQEELQRASDDYVTDSIKAAI